MANIVEFFNSSLDKIKILIEYLFEKSKIQYLKQLNKSMTSYMELTNIYPKRGDYEDDFQDLTRVDTEDNIVLDRDGYNLMYKIDIKKFKSDNYEKINYPMVMLNGKTIPGSKFCDIFNDNIGFWGYYCNDSVNSYFTIDLEIKSNINKIHLATNNHMNVTLYMKEDYDTDWVEIGTRSGNKHVWNFKPQDCISLKFESNTNLFSVSRLEVGLAKYQKNGELLTSYYTIKDLYKLKLITDSDIPDNTGLDFYINVSGQLDEYPIENERIITGGVKWHTASGISPTGILPSGYIDKSLSVKVGYNEWDIVDTNDWTWIVEEKSPNISGIITFSNDYRIIDNSLQKITLGQTTFTENVDYSVEYEIDDGKIIITRLDNSKIPPICLPKLLCSIIVRKKEIVKQVRIYVNLINDKDITIQGFDIPFTIRHVVIKDEVVRDIMQEINISNAGILLTNIDGVPSYILKGLKGRNLIEFTFLDEESNPYIPDPLNLVIINNEYFAKPYELTETEDIPEVYEYNIDYDVDASGVIQQYHIIPGASGLLWYNYAESIGVDSEIQLKVVFTSTDTRNSPTLRGYLISNSVSD